MKHRLPIVAILLGMFVLAQFIGLYVIAYYSLPANTLPLGMGYPQANMQCEIHSFSDFFTCTQYLGTIIFAFIIGITLFLILSKIRAESIIRAWFFFVVSIALLISLESFMPGFSRAFIVSGILALGLAYIKIFRRDILVHNLTEMIIYPGIAAVFVPLLNIYSVLVLLVIISVYDMWAVWHSKIMIKMAKYQINKVQAFPGFFIPYLSGKARAQLKKMRKSRLKGKKIRANVAILGGGDVVFPIITAGVVMLSYGLPYAAAVIAGAALGLLGLFIYSEKRKAYPAMPFITAGIFLALGTAYLVSLM
jgi:presenilin-like A22 family membrane protease